MSCFATFAGSRVAGFSISVRCRMRKEQVGRRMGELLEEGVVVVGYGMTSTGRRAQAYRLACGH